MVIWKRIRIVLGNPIVQLLGLPGIIVVITWIVTHFAKIPIWEIWLAIVFVAACGFWMSNQINAFHERHKKGFSKLTNAEMEDTMRKWLDKREYLHQKRDDKESLFYSEKPIGVHLDLPIDDLITEHTFLNAIDKVRQAHVLMIAYIQMAIATAKTPLVKK